MGEEEEDCITSSSSGIHHKIIIIIIASASSLSPQLPGLGLDWAGGLVRWYPCPGSLEVSRVDQGPDAVDPPPKPDRGTVSGQKGLREEKDTSLAVAAALITVS
jgi:hypothetical protein